MEPRHFWRRLVAILIDYAILSQLAFYLLVPFANGDTVRLSGGIYPSSSCQAVELEADAQSYLQELGVTASSAQLCNTYQNGIFAGTNLLVANQGAENGAVVTLPINQQGEGVQPTYPLGLLAPAIVLLGIILMSWLWNGQTLGKRITGVQAVTRDGDFLTLVQTIQREVLKFAPAIILIVLGFIMPEYSLEQVVPLLQRGEDIALVFGFLGVSTFMYILWWVAPLIWWNGTMPYDRINRTMVERYYA